VSDQIKRRIPKHLVSGSLLLPRSRGRLKQCGTIAVPALLLIQSAQSKAEGLIVDGRQFLQDNEVLYRTLSIWEQGQWIWIIGTAILLGFIAATVHLQLSRKQLRQARNAQLELSGLLINAQEVERSRLASELHDDFSQRLALLALGLDTAIELIDESVDGAKRQLHQLLNSASELGADLHTLSHRLHSSTLERLGLVAGLTALCREFTAQQEIEVDFTHNGIPRSVPPEVSLCIFRIVQEGLRNLKKHSGAAKAQVNLIKAGNSLRVLVCDEGIGFDMKKLKYKSGLGIRSMEERANLLGGRLEIDSKPGEGTRIEARIPVHPKKSEIRAA
jgi:signal transduction histidine kinase